MTLPESFRPCPPIYHIAKECLVILDIFKKRVVWSICLEHRNFKYMPFFSSRHPVCTSGRRRSPSPLPVRVPPPKNAGASVDTTLPHNTHTLCPHYYAAHKKCDKRKRPFSCGRGERGTQDEASILSWLRAHMGT